MRPIRSRRLSMLLASLFVLALVAASCGDDDADTSTGAAEDDAGTDADTTADDSDDGEAADPADDEDAEHTETVAVGAAEPGEAPADGDTVSTDGPGAAWQLVFDSSVPWEEKAPHIENAEALEASHAAYAAAGEGLGGITVEVTAESVDDTAASVVYSLLFGGAPAYADIDGSLTRVDDTWVVTEAEFCGFLASARTPCES